MTAPARKKDTRWRIFVEESQLIGLQLLCAPFVMCGALLLVDFYRPYSTDFFWYIEVIAAAIYFGYLILALIWHVAKGSW